MSNQLYIYDLFVFVKNIFYKNTCNYNYKVIRWLKIFYLFNIMYEKCGGKQLPF